MTDHRSPASSPDLAPQVLKRLGYATEKGHRSWWRRDRAVIPAIIFASESFLLAMAVLAVVEFRGVTESPAIQPNARVLNQALDRAAALGGLEEAFLRIRLPASEIPMSENRNRFVPIIEVDSSPEIAPFVPLVPIFIPPATSTEVDGYERVVASGPGRST